ncbi:hypothetical protein ACFQ3P_20795 [Paraburkholderia sabiae]|uniref:Uncharacterized protein n=1 Tax=Paraburkholderia sabiae TaxID=273251 RepID=A0ABU9QK14_9BURK|nr:hypothetical protein [Paraburkholderia sabiae]WJZ73465.1 hypothetical protein QEN71_25540 [Paraburkholderia sabiae]CAD6542362.1 hypothetical protein LMG24235_03780 [Paraburkholderia sabiae]
MKSEAGKWSRRFLSVDLICSQVLGAMLFVDWVQRFVFDVMAGRVLTSSERGVFLLLGATVALLLRSAFRRWGLCRWVGRASLAIAVVHTILPFDGLSLASIFVLISAVVMEIAMKRSGSCVQIARSGLVHRYGGCEEDSSPRVELSETTSQTPIIPGDEREPAGDTVPVTYAPNSTAVLEKPVVALEVKARTLDIAAITHMTFPLARHGDAANDPAQVLPAGMALSDPDSLGSYIRVQLRVMAGSNALCVSRYLIQYAVTAIQGECLSTIAEVDAVLQRIIDAAARRERSDGSATICLEDVREALRGT